MLLLFTITDSGPVVPPASVGRGPIGFRRRPAPPPPDEAEELLELGEI